MLSQIVRDLGFIPQSFKFVGVPLYYILALLITCVEAGLGLLHGVLADAGLRDDIAKFHMGSIVAAGGGVGVAIVEGFFYSRIMPTRTETVTIPLVNYTVAQTDIFFTWGFLLVMTLFGLGLISYRMSARVLRGTALSTVRKQLRAFTKDAVRWSNSLQQAETLANSARSAVRSGHGPDPAPAFAGEAVERLLTELRALVQASPEWVTINQQPLGAPEVLHLARQSLLWVFLAAASIIVSAFTGIASFTRLIPDTASPIVLAVGQMAFAAAVGFLNGWGETVVQEYDWQKVTAPQWSRLIGLILGGFFVLSYLVLGTTAYSMGIHLLWIGNLLICLIVAATCYQLTPLLGLLAIWIQRVLHLLARMMDAAYRLLIATMLLGTVILDLLMTVLAGPLLVIKGPPVSKALTTYADEPR